MFLYIGDIYIERETERVREREGAKNVSWSWLSPLRGWVSLTMAFPGKFV